MRRRDPLSAYDLRPERLRSAVRSADNDRMTVLAHAGHWIGALLYVAPVGLLVVAVAVREFKGSRDGGSPPVEGTGAADGAAS